MRLHLENGHYESTMSGKAVGPLTPPKSPSAAPLDAEIGKWEAVAARKRAEREALLDPSSRVSESSSAHGPHQIRSSILTSQEEEIVCLPATELAAAIRARKYTSVQVIQAYIRAATVAQDITNCLTEICFDAGLKRAAELDAYQARTGSTIGPLHGVPVSVKDHINMEGTDAATGFVGWAYGRVATKDAVAVRCVRLAGAVIYCKTANPQSLLAIETHNNIYGRTTNLYNKNLSSGGSSGGEGALVAMRGSPLGIGTDIAGSIRLPALWNGIYGLRPSVGRLPHTGLQGPHDGMDALMGVVGPLARSVDDLELFCSSILSPTISPWHLEAQLINKPWTPYPTTRAPDLANSAQPLPGGGRKLTIALMLDDGMVLPHPPILSALRAAAASLRAAGHTVVPWTPVRPAESDKLLFTLCLQDKGDEYRDHLALSGEPAIPLIEWLLETRVPEERVSYPSGLWELAKVREKLRQDGIEAWNSLEQVVGAQVDAILCPGAPSLAPRHDRSRHWGYTGMWNILDWPAVTFPVEDSLTVGAEAGQDVASWPPFEPRSAMEKEVWAEWNPAWYENAPVGLQLVGRRLEEEKLLSDLRILEGALKQA